MKSVAWILERGSRRPGGESDALWNTILKLMCRQQKASEPISAFTRTTASGRYNLRTRCNSRPTCSNYLYMCLTCCRLYHHESTLQRRLTSHQTSVHCACKIFVKNYGVRREGRGIAECPPPLNTPLNEVTTINGLTATTRTWGLLTTVIQFHCMHVVLL